MYDALKCKHGHVLQGNTCRVVPVKINHTPRGRRRSFERVGKEEIREKGSRPLSVGSFCLVPFEDASNDQKERVLGGPRTLPSHASVPRGAVKFVIFIAERDKTYFEQPREKRYSFHDSESDG